MMGTMSEPMLREFREEVVTTKRALERIPKDKLTWKPHPKSMSFGQLAWHVAVVPGNLAKITQRDISTWHRLPLTPAAEES